MSILKRFVACVILFAFVPSAVAQSIEFQNTVDEMTDESDPIIFFYPEESGSDGVILGLKCFSDGPQLIAAHKYLGGDRNDQIEVQMRFDDRPALSSSKWSLFSGSKTSFALSGTDRFIRESIRSDELLVRMTDPLDGEQLDNRYSLSGFSASLDRYDAACDSFSRSD